MAAWVWICTTDSASQQDPVAMSYSPPVGTFPVVIHCKLVQYWCIKSKATCSEPLNALSKLCFPSGWVSCHQICFAYFNLQEFSIAPFTVVSRCFAEPEPQNKQWQGKSLSRTRLRSHAAGWRDRANNTAWQVTKTDLRWGDRWWLVLNSVDHVSPAA